MRAQPNDWHAQVKKLAGSASQTGGKGERYVEFWTKFLARVHKEHPTWSKAHKPSRANWLTMPSPLKGTVYGSNFAKGSQIRTELYIDTGDGAKNLELFNGLREHRVGIEAQYGKSLSWEELPGKQACRIADYSLGDAANVDEYDGYIDWFFDTGQRLREALASAFAAVGPYAG